MHLHVQAKLLQEIVRSFSGTTCQPIQHMLRRICVQLCDLASPTALLIMRTVLDLIVEDLQRYFHFVFRIFPQVRLAMDTLFSLRVWKTGFRKLNTFTCKYTQVYNMCVQMNICKLLLIRKLNLFYVQDTLKVLNLGF